MVLPERESRPEANRTASISTAIKNEASLTPAADRFCCSALTLDERMTAARFAILCGVDRCARTVLRGEVR